MLMLMCSACVFRCVAQSHMKSAWQTDDIPSTGLFLCAYFFLLCTAFHSQPMAKCIKQLPSICCVQFVFSFAFCFCVLRKIYLFNHASAAAAAAAAVSQNANRKCSERKIEIKCKKERRKRKKSPKEWKRVHRQKIVHNTVTSCATQQHCN